MRIRRRVVPVMLIATGVLVAAGVPAASASVSPSTGAPSVRPPSAGSLAAEQAAGSYRSVPARRVLDTRTGVGGQTGPVPARATITVGLTGTAGVPAGRVSAVVANLTVVTPAASGYITAFPDGTSRPVSSDSNFSAGQTRAHLEILIPGVDGRARFYNGSSGTTNLVLDVTGYYVGGMPTADGAFAALTPVRVLDTRIGLGAPKSSDPGEVTLVVAGHGGVPATGVSAVAIDVIAASPAAGGHLSVVSSYQDFQPVGASVSFQAGHTVSGLQVAALNDHGQIVLDVSSAGSVGLVADIFGYYLGGTPSSPGLLGTVAPANLLDTRYTAGQNTPSPIAAHTAASVIVAGEDGIPPGATDVALTVTVTGAEANGYLNVYASGTAAPATSTLNFTANTTVNNLVFAPVGNDGAVVLSNQSDKSIEVIVDVAAYVGVLPGPLSWSAPQTVEWEDDLSCTSSTFCMAVDERTHDQVLRFDGTTWLPPETVPGAEYLGPLSCASARFCLAMATVSTGIGTGDVDAFAYRDGAWARVPDPPVTNERSLNTTFNALSCPTATFCMDLEEPDDNAYIFNGTDWSTSHNPLPTAPNDLDPVLSCASSTFCVALASEDIGQEYGARFDGSAWTPTAAFPVDSDDVTAISCPSATFCGATTTTNASIFNGRTWTEHSSFAGTDGETMDLQSISCPSTALCVAIGGTGQAPLYQNGVWSTPLEIGGTGLPTAVSCPTTSFCAVAELSLTDFSNTILLGTPKDQ